MTAPERSPHANPAAPTPLRLLSLVAVGVVFVLYEPGAEPSLLNSAVLPLLGLLAGWYLTHSVVVVALGTCLLALAHADPSSADLVVGRLYPLLAFASGAVLVVVLGGRFRQAMARRRAERREARGLDSDPADTDA